MQFNGFNQHDFETFQIEGLDERMTVIQERIQPKFQAIGDVIAADLAAMIGNEMFLHIAKHARRTVNPPSDTWSAYCHDKRGYKKHPHFQIGLWDDHLFLWLAYIYEMPNKNTIGNQFLQNSDVITSNVPTDYVISLDHTKKDAQTLEEIDLTKALERFTNVKKGEFLIGRHISKDDPILTDGDALLTEIRTTFETLLPIYKLSMK
ncbi:YktB family protein [Alkalibacillus aidingensis]|uniref:YktB family protein n=1 Tax=Alkalibacillus aidingensis TaxID=2747607 RepID=UPI001660D982|nr:DUF1054 domain-containing protein [Alkalibacillus aidingensis]